MISWIHSRGKDWGKYRNQELSGYPAMSLMHRIMREGSVGAAIKTHHQILPAKFMPPEIADFHRAVLTMDESVRNVVEVTYRSKAPRDVKAQALGISKSRMYQLLDVAHGYLSARLDIRNNDLSSLSNQSTESCGI